jgi:hypothetical protein
MNIKATEVSKITKMESNFSQLLIQLMVRKADHCEIYIH